MAVDAPTRSADVGVAVLPRAMATPVAAAAAPAQIGAVSARRSPWARALIHAVLIAGSFVMVFPFYWMISTSFKTNEESIASPPTFVPLEWHPENYAIALAAAPFGRYFLNTVVVAFWWVLGALVVSSLAAYAFARMEFVGKNAVFVAFVATMMIPREATIIPNFVIVTKWLGWYNTYQAQIVPHIGNVFAIFLLRQFFMAIPKDLEDAALIDGASALRFLWAIVIPLSVPALITVGLLNFLAAWNAFLWPLLVTSSPEMRPVQLGLQVFSN